METSTHVAFSDESNWNTGTYRSIALMSLKKDYLSEITQKLVQALSESQLKEFKWKDLSTAKQRFQAGKIIDIVFPYLKERKARIDILIWDITDSRHDIRGRDDTKNLGRMYFHLLNNVLKMRWPNFAIWSLYPDEFSEMDWDKLHEILLYKSVLSTEQYKLFETEALLSFRGMLERVFKIARIEPRKSHLEPLLQVSDLFAGLACYSKENFSIFTKWKEEEQGQTGLFEEECINYSNTQKERFQVLDKLIALCNNCCLGVSFNSSGCLRTLDPKNSLNFWWYEPQSEKDKAPIKEKKNTESLW
ncbi:MAG: DUF3800 domain-containing protein [Brevinematales bacterium]|nr:DUF3800 domain-containing protein [Brevinematales bacterium]